MANTQAHCARCKRINCPLAGVEGHTWNTEGVPRPQKKVRKVQFRKDGIYK